MDQDTNPKPVVSISGRITSLHEDAAGNLVQVSHDVATGETTRTPICAQCRRPMGAERSTKRYCSATCRSAARRQRNPEKES